MITLSNLKNVLLNIGFVENDKTNILMINYDNCSVKVDFNNKTIIYPEQITVHDRTTSNFEHPENFVVLECVCQLLKKGYRPEHLELEPRWNLGHEAKGGKADILILDEKGAPLVIIECKTFGNEFNKEKKHTETDGGQLFSYWQQENATRWLALYASDWDGSQIKSKCLVINCTDDANILKMSQKDKDIKTYTKARNDRERYEVWAETYQRQWLDNILFSDESQAYKIGVPPLRKKQLRDFTPEDSIVNRFEEILRHNNVSDKENAFNRLVALFICKLVDEIKKQDFDEVDFQYKQGSDTYEILQDRLQRLHQQGMEEFMKEKIFYVEADYAEKLFQQYTGRQRKAAIDELNRTIRILKFYSNNDFAFKDVHNEELFYQNGKILVEVVQLFQPYRIVYPSKHQFLGDLFERLLTKGFKQNEGQFFTPTPITRFIWDSLPLQSYISENTLPKIIDYACGAGHFLTEAIEAVNAIRKDENNSWVEKNVYGVEKDYRLARVSKISLFMNGAGNGNIIFGDGLENYPEYGINLGEFDILVANPPYSVSGFKQHLKLKNNTFELLPYISNDGSDIETLFVERVAQLLKPKGIAAIILPSSILSKDSSSYICTREILLKNFFIRAIVSFNSNTFSETDTNTVVLFLERFNEPPKIAQLNQDIVDSIFSDSVTDEWEEKRILDAYLNHQNIGSDVYNQFILKKLSVDQLREDDYFKIYFEDFEQSAIKYPRGATKEEKQKIFIERFYDYALSIEKDKIFYFSLIWEQNTVTISAPKSTKEEKIFLGYKWSNRKGSEGIIITKPGGKMYCDSNRYARGTLACAIRNSFIGATTELSEDLATFVEFSRLKDMVDFSRPYFKKSISLTAKKRVEIQSSYPLIKLGAVCEVRIGGTPSRSVLSYFGGTNLWVSIAEMNGQEITDTKEKITDDGVKNSSVKLIPKGTTLLSFKLSIGKTAIAGADLYTNEAIAALIPLERNVNNPNFVYDRYLFHLFSSKLIDLENVDNNAFGQSLNINYLKTELKIPLPPPNIQKRIITECEKIDREYESIRMSIEEYRRKIAQVFESLDVIAKTGGVTLRLSDSYIFDLSIGRRVLDSEMSSQYKIPVYSANVFSPFGMIDKLLITDFSMPSVLWGIDGDWMVNTIDSDIPFYPTDHCGVMRIKGEQLEPKYAAWLLRKAGEQAGFSRNYRASIERISGLTIAVAPIEEQKKRVRIVDDLELKIVGEQKKMDACLKKKIQIVYDLLDMK